MKETSIRRNVGYLQRSKSSPVANHPELAADPMDGSPGNRRLSRWSRKSNPAAISQPTSGNWLATVLAIPTKANPGFLLTPLYLDGQLLEADAGTHPPRRTTRIRFEAFMPSSNDRSKTVPT